MPTISISLTKHPISGDIERIAEKLNGKDWKEKGWLKRENHEIILIDLGEDPLTETEEILIQIVFSSITQTYSEFIYSVNEQGGMNKGTENCEGRLRIDSNGIIEALRKDLFHALKKEGLTREMNTMDEVGHFEGSGGTETIKVGPYMTIIDLPLEALNDAMINTGKCALMLFNRKYTTPIREIGVNTGVDGKKLLFNLKKVSPVTLGPNNAFKSLSAPSYSMNSDSKSRDLENKYAGDKPRILVPQRSHTLSRVGSSAENITNELWDLVTEIDENDSDNFKKKSEKIKNLINERAYDANIKYPLGDMTPMQLAEILGKPKTLALLQSKKQERDKGLKNTNGFEQDDESWEHLSLESSYFPSLDLPRNPGLKTEIMDPTSLCLGEDSGLEEPPFLSESSNASVLSEASDALSRTLTFGFEPGNVASNRNIPLSGSTVPASRHQTQNNNTDTGTAATVSATHAKLQREIDSLQQDIEDLKRKQAQYRRMI